MVVVRENTRANRATGERDWLPCIQRLGLEMVALHLSARENANLEAELVMQGRAVQRVKITWDCREKVQTLVGSPRDAS